MQLQFTIFLHCGAGSPYPDPFTVLLRSRILSAQAPQLRYVVRGTKGVFTKYGLDTQGEQLKAMPTVRSIFELRYSQEPKEIYGPLKTSRRTTRALPNPCERTFS